MWVSARLRIVAGLPVPPTVLDLQLRQSYITPHCIKCRSSRSQAHFVSPHRFAPFGFTQQALCKIAFAGAVASRLHSQAASRLACSRLSPLWCAGTWTLVRRFAHCSGQRLCRACCVCPRPPLGLACFAASPARSARPPPKGAPSEPRLDTQPSVTGSTKLGVLAKVEPRLQHHCNLLYLDQLCVHRP